MDYKEAMLKVAEKVGFKLKSEKVEETKLEETVVEETVVEDVVEETKLEDETIVEETVVDETVEETFKSVVIVDGTELFYEGEIAVDTLLFTNSGLTEAVEDGEYVTEDGVILVVVGGKVTEINSLLEQSENLKQIIKDHEVDNKDLTDQLAKLSKENEQFKKNEIELKKTINDKPAVESLKFKDENTVELTQDEIKKANRIKFRQNLKK